MRSILLAAAAAALLAPMSLVTACGGSSSGDDGGDAGGQVTPTGTHTQFVVNSVKIPTSSTEATGAFGLDVGAALTDKPDGAVDNQLGSVLAALGGMGFDVQTTLNTAVNQGKIILLADFQAENFTSTATAGLKILLGANPMPAPCAGSGDTTCGKQFVNGKFDIAADSPTSALVAGPIVNGTFTGGPGNIQLQLALGGTTPVNLALHNARAKTSGVTASGLSTTIIAGALSKSDLDTMVIPAIQAQLGPLIARDCPYATAANNCACNQCQAPAGGTAAQIAACIMHGNAPSCQGDTANGCVFDDATTGKTVLGLFDKAPKDCMVSVDEVLNNQLIKSLLQPDVCTMATCTAADGLSLGIQVTAVPATFPAQ